MFPGARLTTTTGCSVMVALADLLVSAALEAVIVTVCGAVIVAGAVYKPAADTVPTLGDKDQLTAVLVAERSNNPPTIRTGQPSHGRSPCGPWAM